MAHQGAACNATSVHFGPTVTRTDVLVLVVITVGKFGVIFVNINGVIMSKKIVSVLFTKVQNCPLYRPRGDNVP